MKKVDLSILIPCHNINKLNFFSLKHIMKLKSKYEIEILVLNDYSNDNTLEILNDLSKKDSRIKVLNLGDYSEKKGIGFNRDFLISQAKGEYFFFIDDDDKLNLKHFNFLLNNFLYKYDLITAKHYCSYAITNKIQMKVFNIPQYKCQTGEYYSRDLIFKNLLFAWGKIVRKNIYLQNKTQNNIFFKQEIYEDLDVVYSWYLYKNIKCFYSNKNLIEYRIRKNSLSTNLNKTYEKFTLAIQTYQNTFNKLKEFGWLNEKEQTQYKFKAITELLIMIYALNCSTKQDLFHEIKIELNKIINETNFQNYIFSTKWTKFFTKLALKKLK
ncbi:glycosyltransferase family 2 protein [Mycoplasmopsis gallinarum]|uniref:Putative glycosyltransferase n=1 Tax=Mycoplasmopsis gallinarum TaxID=29557 RepID=A0A168R838_9BACT|nr:glycosyltransferase family 2 protein [Mycoplasmopsis gallinarum]OAB48699.1 putative glycosyltransferase [Mycoplasmopsis gallinarum]